VKDSNEPPPCPGYYRLSWVLPGDLVTLDLVPLLGQGCRELRAEYVGGQFIPEPLIGVL